MDGWMGGSIPWALQIRFQSVSGGAQEASSGEAIYDPLPSPEASAQTHTPSSLH